MIDPRDIVGLVNLHVSKVLTVAEAALPESQFKAFRKLVLDEFGRNGLETEVMLEHYIKQIMRIDLVLLVFHILQMIVN